VRAHRRAAVGTALALVVAAVGPAAASAAPGAVGAPGLGDPLYPQAGNGGIDVRDYSLSLAYDPPTRRLAGTASLRIRATQDLGRFNLDLRGFELGPVRVDGARARVEREGQELTVIPKRTLRAGRRFKVTIPYAGVPETVIDPDGSSEGWVYTADGAVVVGEPQGSPGWYPANDHPSDKATYTVRMLVPEGLTAVGNGVLEAHWTARGRTSFTWRQRQRMAPYLATITIGRFDVTHGRTPSGIPIYNAVDPTQAEAAAPVLAKTSEVVSFLEELFGPYPFDTVGAIVDDAPDLGYALETQTKPVYDRAPDETTLVHELAHQWYGDAVTLSSWPDIWLNEGVAQWIEWLWAERHGGPSTADAFAALAAQPASLDELWNPPPGDPGDPALLFAGSTYLRGAMTLEALRQRIGAESFLVMMRRWYQEHRYGNVTTAQLVALAESVSGQDLSGFFEEWLYRPGKPASIAGASARSALGTLAPPHDPSPRGARGRHPGAGPPPRLGAWPRSDT
jgi:aminopeptidase N